MTSSVIIPTYNGAHKIITLLRSLERQTQLPDEVIVVIDGSTDNTKELLESSHFDLPGLSIITQKNGGRAQVRNKGAQAARGDLFLFFDDDMRLTPDCVAVHIAHHLQYPHSILTGGLEEEVLPASPDMLRFKASLSKRWSQPLAVYDQAPMPPDVAFLTAANCSVDRAVWMQLGGLDERLTDAEDYDLSIRAIKAGIPMYFNHKAFAWHDDIVTCKSYIKRLRQYALAQQSLARIKPELYGAGHKYAVTLPRGAKALFFRLFCSRFWISSVDAGWWRYLLPVGTRDKLYDWIITANGAFYPEKVRL